MPTSYRVTIGNPDPPRSWIANCADGCGRAIVFAAPREDVLPILHENERERVFEARRYHWESPEGRGPVMLRRVWGWGNDLHYWERGHAIRSYRQWVGSASNGRETSERLQAFFQRHGWKMPETKADLRKLTSAMHWAYKRAHHGKGLFGIEAEFFGIDASHAAGLLDRSGIPTRYDTWDARNLTWVVKHDGSVSREGCELASPVLRQTRPSFVNTRKALGILSANGGTVDRSCGLHVHHSSAHLEPIDVAQTLRAYAFFEPVIRTVLPASRHGNDYAKSMRHWDLSGIRTDTFEALGRSLPDRYMAVNVTSLRAHGTIEFRQHNGTLNPDKTLNWVELTRLFTEVGPKIRAGLVDEPSALHLDRLTIPGMVGYLGGTPELAEYYMGRAEQLTNDSDHEDQRAEESDGADGACRACEGMNDPCGWGDTEYVNEDCGYAEGWYADHSDEDGDYYYP